MITIVGLGPSDRSMISVGAHVVLRGAPTIFVRTARHPAVDELAAEGIKFESLDYIYDSSETFEEVYARIAERIVAEVERRGDVVYAVPGHPLVGELSVAFLIGKARDEGIQVRVVGSESFIEASLEALGFGFGAGLKIVDALSMSEVAPSPDVGNLIYQVYDRAIASDTKLALMEYYPDEYKIAVVTGAGTTEQRVEWMPLYMLDRIECDHLTTVYVPPVGEKR